MLILSKGPKTMSLLKKLLRENAASGAIGANSIAAVPSPLFKRKKKTMIRRITDEGSLVDGGIITTSKVGKKTFTFKDALRTLSEDITGGTDVDTADVVSKLDAAQKKSKIEKDTRTFGLEDDKGNVVRVYVRSDQAEEFETALEQLLAGSDENDDKQNTSMEIAEVLFKLKDKFDIVDVNWGDVPQDEEEEQEVEGGEGQEGQEGQDGDESKNGKEGELPDGMEQDAAGAEAGGSAGDESGAQSALDKVIDMMKADADAKKAEAKAREAEARAKEAEYAARAASSKVKQEEEVLDMETHEKEQKDIEKEAKQLARLAKYRHQKAGKASRMLHQHGGSQPEGEEEEEQYVHGTGTPDENGGNRIPNDPDGHYSGSKSKVSIEDLRDMIYTNLKGNN